MYAVLVRRGLASSPCIFHFPWKKPNLKVLLAKKPSLSLTCLRQQREIYCSRVKFSREGKLETANTAAKPKAIKSVPKISELRKLLQVAHPERWKIGGNYLSFSYVGHNGI